MFTASHETLIWARKNKKGNHTFNYDVACNFDWEEDSLKNPNKQMRSVWSIPTPKAEEKKFGKHPTQKSLRLLERIILTSTNKKDVVLDPFCGSATTGVAAIKHGRRFVGIDTEEDYLDRLAVLRLEESTT
jgi:site-specific DNA-methyltransferase (adenine-specific)